MGGLEPLPWAYDLRNKRVRMRQNMVFSTTQNTKNFLGRPFRQWRGGYPTHPPWRLRHLNPSHSKILGTPLVADDFSGYQLHGY